MYFTPWSSRAHAAAAIRMFGLGAAIAMPTASVLANDESDRERALPAVVVTATRSEQSSFDIPAAIDAVKLDNSDNDALGINVSEVLSLVPGVLARNRQNYAQDEQISIRGFGARSTFGVRGVRLYTDGIPASMPDGSGQVSHFNLDSADRVEVLRGPFSALYGNSSGGVIQIFTADGSDEFQLRTGLVGGSYGTGRASVNLRGSGGPIGYNVDLTHFETDGYRDHSAAERNSGNAKVTWKLGDSGKLTFLANTVSIPGAQDPLGLTWAQFQENPRQVASVAEQFNTRKSVDQSQGGAIWEQDLSEHNSIRVLAYTGQREVEQFLAIPIATQANPLHSGGVVSLDGDYSGTDARWTWSNGPFEVTAGASYESQDQQRRGYANFIGTEVGVRGVLRRNESNRVHNFDQYAQASWKFADDWSLMAGVRHSEIAFRAVDHYITATNPDDSGTRDYSATTPVVGLLYSVSPAANLYATWGKGFETPTFAELGYRNDGGAGLNFGLLPARSRNGEFGAKLRFSDSIESNLAVFRADTDDEIAIATNVGGRTTYQNIGSARRQGAEASLLAHFGDHWKLQFAGTWLDATFRSPFLTCSGTPCTTPNTPVAAGTRIPGVPRSNLRAALTWGGELGWRAGAQVDRIGSVSVNDIGTQSAPAYTVVGLDVGYGFELSSGKLRTFLNLDNLFNRDYIGSVIVNDGNGRYYEPGQGRSVMLGAQWLWAAR
jgi:iron complex outermembrane receptor protein